MPDLHRSNALLRSICRRLLVVSFGRRFYFVFLITAGLYALVFLASRLLGLIPDLFEPTTLMSIPAVALLFALLLHHRPTVVEAARKVDGRHGTKDLFLTVALLEHSGGQYKPLVARDAESQAQAIAPTSVVPYRVWRRSCHIAGLLASLLLAVLYLQQFDPFGRVEAADQAVRQQQQLAESREETRVRAARLRREDDKSRESEVDHAIEDLKATFKKMRPPRKKENFAALSQNQKVLGRINAKKLKELLAKAAASQEFGGADKGKLQEWKRELQQGSGNSLRKEMDKMQAALEALKKAKDPVERAAIKKELKKSLRDLEQFASESVNSDSLSAALKRAMQQLEMSNVMGLSQEALEALSESLDLTNLELQEIAQSVEDLKRLEEALKALQMAKCLNEQGELDGECCGDCKSLADYAELFANMMGNQPDMGAGMRGPGIGEGGEAPEDDSLESDFKPERSPVALQAGKILLSLKTKGLTDSGDAKKDYRRLVSEVKQGVSEAILEERIPPGYHEGIKKYFDTIPNSERDNR